MLTNKELYKIAKYTYRESFFESQMSMSGTNTAKIMESIKKNQKYMKMQSITMKIATALLIITLIMVPIYTFDQVGELVGQINLGYSEIPLSRVIFVGNVGFSLYFLLQFLYQITFGMFFASGYLGGDMFQWLFTLPLSQRELRKVAFFSFFQLIDVQVIALSLVLPLATIIATGKVMLAIATLVLSLVQTAFTFSCFLLVGQFLSKIMKDYDVNSKKATLIRLLAMFSYIVGIMFVSLGIQVAMGWVPALFQNTALTEAITDPLNKYLPLIPYPINAGYIITYLYMGKTVPNVVIISSVGGFVIFILLTRAVVNKALFYLSQVYRQNTKKINFKKEKPTVISDIILEVSKPHKAFYKRDLQMSTRDFQLLMLLIMPVILPTISFVMVRFIASESIEGEELITAIMLTTLYVIMGATMMIFGLLDVETSGATINSSLPIVVRDQAKAKLKFLLIVLPFGTLVPTIFVIGLQNFWSIFLITLLTVPIGPLTAVMLMLIKVRMFGRLKSPLRTKFVLEDINIRAKFWKWVLIILLDFVIYALLMTGFVSYIISDRMETLPVIFLPVEIVWGIVLYVIFNKMFPKPPKY